MIISINSLYLRGIRLPDQLEELTKKSSSKISPPDASTKKTETEKAEIGIEKQSLSDESDSGNLMNTTGSPDLESSDVLIISNYLQLKIYLYPYENEPFAKHQQTILELIKVIKEFE